MTAQGKRNNYGFAIGLVVAMMLSVVVLGGSSTPASAVQGDCDEGEQVQSACYIQGPAPTSGLRCPTESHGVIFDGFECYRLIDAPQGPPECPDPYELDIEDSCIFANPEPAPDAEPAFECPFSPSPVIEESTLIDGVSVVVLCRTDSSPGIGVCPSGTFRDPSYVQCRVPVDHTIGPICADGYFFFVDACFKVGRVALDSTIACGSGVVLFVDECVTTGSRPGRGPSSCPVSDIVFEDGIQCYVLVPPIEGSCPTGTTPDPDLESCRQPVERMPGPYYCAADYALIEARCIKSAPARTWNPETFEYNGPVPDYDCLGAGAGTSICQYRPTLSQSGVPNRSSLRPGLETTLTFEACAGGSASFAFYDENGWVGAAPPVSMSEASPGVYSATFEGMAVGEYVYSVFFECPTNIGLGSVPSSARFIEPYVPVRVGYTALDPARILDTRNELDGDFSTPWSEGELRDVQIAGVGGVPVGAVAVAINVTTVAPNGAGETMAPFSWFEVGRAGFPSLGTASHNFGTAGATTQLVNDLLIAPVGFALSASIMNKYGDVDVVIDVVGYFSYGAGSGLIPLEMDRILDSRSGLGNLGPFSTPWGEGETRSVTVTGSGGIPADNVEAVVLNVTSVNPTASVSWLTITPAGNASAAPTAALNFGAGEFTTEIVNDIVIAKVGAGGAIDITNALGSVDVVIDVAGYFTTDESAPGYWSMIPERQLDTRNSQEGEFDTPWGEGQTRTLSFSQIPCSIDAVALHVTTVSPSAAVSWLTFSPGGVDPSTTAAHLFGTGDYTSELGNDLIIAKLNDAGELDVRNEAGSVDLVVDLVGFFAQPDACV